MPAGRGTPGTCLGAWRLPCIPASHDLACLFGRPQVAAVLGRGAGHPGCLGPATGDFGAASLRLGRPGPTAAPQPRPEHPGESSRLREKRQAGLFPPQQHLAASREEAGDNYPDWQTRRPEPGGSILSCCNRVNSNLLLTPDLIGCTPGGRSPSNRCIRGPCRGRTGVGSLGACRSRCHALFNCQPYLGNRTSLGWVSHMGAGPVCILGRLRVVIPATVIDHEHLLRLEAQGSQPVHLGLAGPGLGGHGCVHFCGVVPVLQGGLPPGNHALPASLPYISGKRMMYSEGGDIQVGTSK